MKRLGKKKEGDIEPDLTSFSDIANLLIIFFILTTSMAHPWGRRVDMPSASTPPEKSSEQSDTPTVNIFADKLTLAEGSGKDHEVTMDELRSFLWKQDFRNKDEKKRSVALETQPDVPYERYYQVATAIAETGGVVAILGD